jgi:DNA-binding CsgD family transcriptional regulator
MGLDTEKRPTTPSQSAFIFYGPATPTHPEQFYYNEEACSIFARSAQSQGIRTDIPPYVLSLCLKWSETLENQLGQAPSSGSVNGRTGMRHIAMLESEKRKYVVKATALSGSSESQGEKQYLFVMERASAESANLSMIFRKYKLSVREQEIVRLLLTGGSNKEIAYRLRLSENTIKGYMKLLMRKLGVNNRAGIIAALLVEK